jgi:hypothetical protein
MLTINELSRLSTWLRCYPVEGMETERKLLTDAVERVMRELAAKDNTVHITEWMGR